jgi:hypothetical protein
LSFVFLTNGEKVSTMPLMSTFTSLASTVATLAHQYGLKVRLVEYRLQQQWPGIVGDQIAAHTRPDTIRFRTLYLIAANSVWLQQLTFLKPSLLEKINAAAGSDVVSNIVLRVGEVGGETSRERGDDGKELLGPGPDSLTEAARYAESVSDPDLRAQLTMVMARALHSDGEKPEPRSL